MLLALLVYIAVAEHARWRIRIAPPAASASPKLAEDASLLENAPGCVSGTPLACADHVEIPKADLFYPYGLVDAVSGHTLTALPPWSVDLSPDAKVYRSHYVTQEFSKLFAQNAPGLKVSYMEVFNALARGLCLPYIVGGQVRDLLLEKTGLDTDIGFSCSVRQVESICQRNGWPVLVKGDYVRIGADGAVDPIEGKVSQRSVYAPTTDLEYACNSLVFDVGVNSAVIDRTGTGLEDDIARRIRIPGSPESWDVWADGKNGLVKLVRYFKLRAKPKAYVGEPETAAYVVRELKRRVKLDRGSAQAVLQHQLAHFLEGLEPASAAVKLGYLRDAMLEDLGQTWYDEFVRGAEPAFADVPEGALLEGSLGREASEVSVRGDGSVVRRAEAAE